MLISLGVLYLLFVILFYFIYLFIYLFIYSFIYLFIYLFEFWATSQEQYSMWSWFLVQSCKMMIPASVFKIWKSWFFGLLVGEKGKQWSKMTKKLCLLRFISKDHPSYVCHFWYTCVKWQYLQVFLSFSQNFDFLGC